MTAFRLFVVSLLTLILALVLANTLPAPVKQIAGAAIFPLFVFMLISLNISKKSLSDDRVANADYGRNNKDAALVDHSSDCGGADAG